MCGKEHELSRTYGCKAKTNVAAAEKLSCDPGEEKDPAAGNWSSSPPPTCSCWCTAGAGAGAPRQVENGAAGD